MKLKMITMGILKSKLGNIEKHGGAYNSLMRPFR